MPRHELNDELERSPDTLKSGVDLAKDIKNTLDQLKDVPSAGAGTDIRQAASSGAGQAATSSIPNAGAAGAASGASAASSSASSAAASSAASSGAATGVGASAASSGAAAGAAGAAAGTGGGAASGAAGGPVGAAVGVGGTAITGVDRATSGTSAASKVSGASPSGRAHAGNEGGLVKKVAGGLLAIKAAKLGIKLITLPIKILFAVLGPLLGTILLVVILNTILPKTVSDSALGSESGYQNLDAALKGSYQEYIDFTKNLVNDAVTEGRKEVEQILADGNYHETEFIRPETPQLSTSISYLVAYYGVWAGEDASFEAFKEELQKHKNELYVYRFRTEDMEIETPPPTSCDYSEITVSYTDLSGTFVREILYTPIEGSERETAVGEMVYTYEALTIPNVTVIDETGKEKFVLMGTYYRRSDEMSEAVSATTTVTKAIAEEIEISMSFLNDSWPMDLKDYNEMYGSRNIDVLGYHIDFLTMLCPDENHTESGFVQRSFVSDEGLFGFLFSGEYNTFNTGKNSPSYCRQKLDEIMNTEYPPFMIPDKHGIESNWLTTAPIPFRQRSGNDSCYYIGPSALVILSKDGTDSYYTVRLLDNNIQTLVPIVLTDVDLKLYDSERITRIDNASFLGGNKININGIVHNLHYDYIYYPGNIEFGYPRFHKNVIGILRSVWANLANMNYVFGSTSLYTYEYRYMNNPTTGPTGSLSYHSYGIATDIGWGFAKQTKEIWISYGFYSGLDWEEYDPPHMCLSNH